MRVVWVGPVALAVGRYELGVSVYHRRPARRPAQLSRTRFACLRLERVADREAVTYRIRAGRQLIP